MAVIGGSSFSVVAVIAMGTDVCVCVQRVS